MKTKSRLSTSMIAGLLAAVPWLPAAHGQSADALINKLVQKGILSSQEAKDLQQESNKDFSAAYAAKSGLPSWVTQLKFDNDFRFRFEENRADNPAYTARNRYRYRLRLGAVATLGEDFDIGVRLASGNPQTNPSGTLVGGQPITANQDLNSLESRKFLWIDLAYAKWTPIKDGDWTISGTVGKMNQPFMLSNMIWDYDINPEGAAFQADYRFNEKHKLKTVGAFFVLDEISTGAAAQHDPFVYGGQMVLESKWTPKFETAVGVAGFDIAHKDSLSAATQPFYNSGNSRLPGTVAPFAGPLKYNMDPVIITASATYKLDSFPLYPGKFPLKLSGEYMNNPGAPSASNTGYNLRGQLGKAGKKGAWEVSYRYQWLEANAWFDALTDDDNGAFYATGNPQMTGTGKLNGWYGGTNVRGHLMEATYSLTDYLNFTFTYYLNSLIINAPGQTSSAGHFMGNIMWKF